MSTRLNICFNFTYVNKVALYICHRAYNQAINSDLNIAPYTVIQCYFPACASDIVAYHSINDNSAAAEKEVAPDYCCIINVYLASGGNQIAADVAADIDVAAGNTHGVGDFADDIDC